MACSIFKIQFCGVKIRKNVAVRLTRDCQSLIITKKEAFLHIKSDIAGEFFSLDFFTSDNISEHITSKNTERREVKQKDSDE